MSSTTVESRSSLLSVGSIRRGRRGDGGCRRRARRADHGPVLSTNVHRAPGAAAGLQPGQPGHRGTVPGFGRVSRGVRSAVDRPGSSIVCARPRTHRLQTTFRWGSARSSTPSWDIISSPPSVRSSVTRSPRRSPTPGTRCTGSSRPNSSLKKPACTSGPGSTRCVRCGPYRVVRRIEETRDVISLILEPADDGALPEISPGQYVSVFVDLPNGQRQPRQYTVSSTGLGNRLQITVRRG